MNFNFYNPVAIEFGSDYLESIQKLDLNNILLITSKSFVQKGIINQIQSLLGDKIKKILSNIDSNPQIEFLTSLKNPTEGIESILAIGGGSVIDVAKILSINSELQIIQGNVVPKENKPFIPVYALPSTSGTSSELTPWATIWDKTHSQKYSLHLKNLYCKKAIYIPSLTLTLSKELTLSTALDALSHSLESIWNKNANPISTNNALKAIELITTYLPPLIENLDSLELREQIMLGSIFAGLAFCSTQTALAHALSYPITMEKNIPHGIACSFTLPFLLDNLTHQNALEILTPYKEKIKNLFATLKIPTNFKDYGLDKKDIERIFSSLNARAKNSLFDTDKLKSKLIK